jgi:GT2 family glycosyltransferase
LRSCVESLLPVTASEILVIDNASSDGSIEFVQEFAGRVRLLRNNVNRGFAAGVNQAFQVTSTSCVLILNPDVQATSGAVHLLEKFLEAHPQAAAIGGYVGDKYLPKPLPALTDLVRENLGFSRAGVHERQFLGHATPVQVEQPAAAALMIRRAAFDEVGGFDEQFYPAWYEDVDFCQRLKAKNWQVYFAPQAEFLHEGGYSAQALGAPDFLRSYYTNQLRYTKKHFGTLGGVFVRVSIAVGMIGRIIGRPRQAGAYGKTFVRALTRL